MVDLQSRNLSTMEEHRPSSLEIEETRSQGRAASYIFFKYVRPCAAEFLGTMLFVFADVCSITVTGFTAGLTHAFMLFVLVAVTAGVSGGHLNPAVTMALTICRGLDLLLAPFYVLSQLLGAIVGAALARAVLPSAFYDAISGGIHMVGKTIEPGQAILAEMLATSILILAVLMVAFDERNKSVLGPLAIGLAVGGGIFALWSISGGSMNPARSFGPAVVRNSWGKHYVYWVGPALGGLFSVLVYQFFLASPNRLWVPFREPIY